MSKILVKSGKVRQIDVENVSFTMLTGLKTGASGSWITVDPKTAEGPRAEEIRSITANVIRVKVNDNSSFEFLGDNTNNSDFSKNEEPEKIETDEEIVNRIRSRFSILEDMTNAAVDGIIKGLVVSGPPGVGKTYGIESSLEKAAFYATIEGNTDAKYGVEKGSATPISLYKLLYEYSSEKSVLVLDDSDTILYDETSLNLLKAVLDSGKKRRVSWRSETRSLERDGVPETFEFKGSVIFITNLNLENSRGKIGEHMKALLSRCHYIDLEIGTIREKFLRCKQIIGDGMLAEKGFGIEEQDELLSFIEENKETLRELSLRMVSKIADLYKMSSERWKEYAENTCMR